MDVKKLGGCLHKLGVKYDRPLFELATKAFDEDQSGLIEFDEFVEMFATLRASDELALGDFGAPSAELTAQELSDVKASFDAWVERCESRDEALDLVSKNPGLLFCKPSDVKDSPLGQAKMIAGAMDFFRFGK